MAEVFGSEDPPGSMPWEQFTDPLLGSNSPEPAMVQHDGGEEIYTETSGCYLRTSANTESMILSLEENRERVTIMGAAEINKLKRWHDFYTRHERYCLLYQSDF